MENKNLKKGSLIAMGALAFGIADSNASDLFIVEDLGTGAELRSELIGVQNNIIDVDALNTAMELSCGEKSKEESGNKTKAKESKCGEGKCGEGKSEKASKSKKEAKSSKKAKKEKTEKTEEAKCGEGKCGEGKCGGL